MKKWVIQIVSGVYSAYGPYSSDMAAWNRYRKTSGGEVHFFESWETEPERVIDAFKSVQLSGAY